MLCFAGNPAILFLDKTVSISVLQIHGIKLYLAKYFRVSLFPWLLSEPRRLSEGARPLVPSASPPGSSSERLAPQQAPGHASGQGRGSRGAEAV